MEIGGDILFKEWTIQHKNYLLICGVILYMFATVFWAYSLKYQDLSKAVVIFAVITLIVGASVGVFVYKENLTILNIIGVLVGLVS
ncbi:MAG: EamA family transporter, partial [bacterium]